jgi:hypothetical protein
MREKKRLVTEQFLRREILALKKLEHQCFASRRRFGFYRYLAVVYGLFRLRRSGEIESAARRIADLFNLTTRKGTHTHPIRVIIDASSQADHKSKSRWTQALRFAWRERERWSDLETFLRRNGGPAGCASQFAALHPRSPRGCVRVGGENRVPKSPLFVDQDWLGQRS